MLEIVEREENANDNLLSELYLALRITDSSVYDEPCEGESEP